MSCKDTHFQFIFCFFSQKKANILPKRCKALAFSVNLR